MQLYCKKDLKLIDFETNYLYTICINTHLGKIMELRTTNLKDKPISKKTPKNTDNIHKDHRSRLKNQFLSNGVDGLTDIQKLELLLFYSIPQKTR
jgi:hypothetical protein